MNESVMKRENIPSIKTLVDMTYYEFLTDKIKEIVVKELPVNSDEGPIPDLSQTEIICGSIEVDIDSLENPSILHEMADSLISQMLKKAEKDKLVLVTVPEVHLDPTMFKLKKFGVYCFANCKRTYEMVGWAMLDNRDILRGNF